MKTFRTAVFVLLVLGVAAVLIVKHRAAVAPGESSPAARALADAKEKGQPVWLLIHSTRCKPCIEMQKVYDELEPQFGSRIKFINLDTDDPAEQKFLDGMGVRLIPLSVFVDARGKTVEKKLGAIPSAEVRKALLKLQGE